MNTEIHKQIHTYRKHWISVLKLDLCNEGRLHGTFFSSLLYSEGPFSCPIDGEAFEATEVNQ